MVACLSWPVTAIYHQFFTNENIIVTTALTLSVNTSLIKVKHSDLTQQTNTLISTCVWLHFMEQWKADQVRRAERSSSFSKTAHSRWAQHAPTVKQESHNWPMTLLVLVYRWLWWVSDCYRWWRGPDRICRAGSFMWNCTVCWQLVVCILRMGMSQ